MQIITGFTGTNHITAEMDRDVNIGILGPQSYVLSVGKKIEAEVASNNEIKISDGVIVHQGCAGVIKKNTYDSVTIMNGSQGMKRVDLIVLRYERNQDTGVESLDLEVIQGTPAESDPAIPGYTDGDIQAGDLVADMPLYKVELDGINIVAVEPLFQVLLDMSTLNADLADKLTWTMIREVSGGGFGTQSIDLSKYSELMLTVGPFVAGNTEENSRVLASTIIPVSLLKNVLGKTDAEGVFQVVYSGSNSRMFGGLNYSSENTVQIRASGSSAKATLWAR